MNVTIPLDIGLRFLRQTINPFSLFSHPADPISCSHTFFLNNFLASVVNLKRFPTRASDDLESKIPPGFPPTFLYSLSWEDPREDDKVLDIQPTDTILTLTAGGCNSLDLVLQVS